MPQMISPNLFKTVSDFRPILRLLQNPSPLAQYQANPQPAPIKPRRAKKRRKPTVSVILIHRDRPHYVGQTLRSLAKQTLDTFEVIIIDDGSTDAHQTELTALVAAAGLPDIHIHFTENSYPGKARNHGARLATGDAFFFLDDDNILAPQTLAAFQTALQRADIALSFFRSFRDDTQPETLAIDPHAHPEIRGPSYAFIGPQASVGLFHNLVGNSSLMIRRETFERLGGFTPHYGIGLEDYAFMMRCAGEKYVVLPEPFLHFREHPQKIRRHHVDWRAPTRLQAGEWRVINEMGDAPLTPPLTPMARAYARQLFALTQYQYVPRQRPNFFRLRSVWLHQYVRPFLARRDWLRRSFSQWQIAQSPLYKRLAKVLFQKRRY